MLFGFDPFNGTEMLFGFDPLQGLFAYVLIDTVLEIVCQKWPDIWPVNM